MDTFEDNLDKYATLAVKTGVNVQKGQTLVINAPILANKLVRKIAEKAYEAGAKNVHVEWNDDQLGYLKFKLAPDEAFTEFPMWKASGMEELAAGGAAFLTVYAPNPDLLKDISPDRIAAANKTQAMALQKYRSYLMADKAAWSIVAVPTEEWAQKMYPNLNVEEAMQELWKMIFDVTRVSLADPIQAWKEHIALLATTSAFLNKKQYKQLVYEAPGTNLTIALTENHIWHGGSSMTDKGVQFSPNMPTEEVFSMPHKDGANGVVRSTKPLNYGGTLINGFSLTFKDGVVIDFTADEGYDTLKHLLDTDEGSRRLGEVALVPYDSPISNTNLIFYNTLFDENASSHIALGKAYPINIKDGSSMTEVEFAQHGVNTSLVHVDFMIGSAEMNIDGVTKDGKVEPLMRNGNWVAFGDR
jgi:aminopeptidase